MKGGENDRTARNPDGSTPLICPLVAEPRPRQGWPGKAMAGGLICAVLAGAVVAALNQNRAPVTGKLAIVASGTDKLLDQANDGGGQFSVFGLEPGTCLRELADATDVQDVPVVACEDEHAAEVVASVRMPDGPWPGTAAVDQFATDRCVPAIQGAGVDASPNLRWTYFGPSESSWNLRYDRAISCLVVSRGEPLIGSVTSPALGRTAANR